MRLASVRGAAWRQSPGVMLCWMDRSLADFRRAAAEAARSLKQEPEVVFRRAKSSFEINHMDKGKEASWVRKEIHRSLPVCKCRETEEGLREGLKRLMVLTKERWPSNEKGLACLEPENSSDVAEMILKACLLRKDPEVSPLFRRFEPPSPFLSRSEGRRYIVIQNRSGKMS